MFSSHLLLPGLHILTKYSLSVVSTSTCCYPGYTFSQSTHYPWFQRALVVTRVTHSHKVLIIRGFNEYLLLPGLHILTKYSLSVVSTDTCCYPGTHSHKVLIIRGFNEYLLLPGLHILTKYSLSVVSTSTCCYPGTHSHKVLIIRGFNEYLLLPGYTFSQSTHYPWFQRVLVVTRVHILTKYSLSVVSTSTCCYPGTHSHKVLIIRGFNGYLLLPGYTFSQSTHYPWFQRVLVVTRVTHSHKVLIIRGFNEYLLLPGYTFSQSTHYPWFQRVLVVTRVHILTKYSLSVVSTSTCCYPGTHSHKVLIIRGFNEYLLLPGYTFSQSTHYPWFQRVLVVTRVTHSHKVLIIRGFNEYLLLPGYTFSQSTHYPWFQRILVVTRVHILTKYSLSVVSTSTCCYPGYTFSQSTHYPWFQRVLVVTRVHILTKYSLSVVSTSTCCYPGTHSHKVLIIRGFNEYLLLPGYTFSQSTHYPWFQRVLTGYTFSQSTHYPWFQRVLVVTRVTHSHKVLIIRGFNEHLLLPGLHILTKYSLSMVSTSILQVMFQYLQKQPCHLPEETGVQLLCAAGYDIWFRDLDTDQTSTGQTCGSTDQNGKTYAQHHIQR